MSEKMDFETLFTTIKSNFTRLLNDMGGKAEISVFGKAYLKKHGEIDLKVSQKNSILKRKNNFALV
jgi:hypothetical protein